MKPNLTPEQENLINAYIMMAAVVLLVIAAMLLALLPASAGWACRGLVTSNNSCIGSESNFNSYRNHEPFYATHGWVDRQSSRAWGTHGRRR